MGSIRLVTLDDLAELADLYRNNRDFLAPWEPNRNDDFFSIEGQRSIVKEALERHEQGLAYPYVIVDVSSHIVGRINLWNIVRGAFQSAGIGYWVSAKANGNGFASAAVHDVVGVAFDDLGLHRIEAGTLTHNIRSQRVLEKNGFVRYGLAPSYLAIAGRWQDHVLYQALNPLLPDPPDRLE